MDSSKVIIYDGLRFIRFGGRYYYHQKTINGKRFITALHRYIWEKHNNTKIPKGYLIHHIDGNPFNNEYTNLQLLQDNEHYSLSKGKCTDKQRKHLENIRYLTKKWHASKEGRKQHSIQSKKAWDENRVKKTTHICPECKKEFLSYRSDTICCSKKCYQRYHNKVKAIGKVFTCIICGEKFTPAKVSGKARKTCGKKCHSLFRTNPKYKELRDSI